MRFAGFTAVLLLALTAAGCLSDEPADDPAPGPGEPDGIPVVSAERIPDPGMEAEFATVIESDHFGAPEMHHVRELHVGLEYGLELVGWNALTDKLPPGAAGTGWGAAGLWKNYACVAQFAGTGAIAIIDIADPANIEVMSQVDDPLVNGDCHITSDGNYLLAGAYLGPGPNPDVGEGGDLCPRGCPGGGGINVWDMWDPLESTCRHASLSIL